MKPVLDDDVFAATLAGLGDELQARPDSTLGRREYAATVMALTAAGPDGAPRGRRGPVVLPHLTLSEEGAAATGELCVRGLLGEGGMGRVVVATQRSLGRDVAVKTVRPDRVSALASEALLHEARLTGTLEHPNVIPVHALGCDDDGMPVMVMKRVDGVPWRALLRDDDHPLWRATGGDRLGRHLEVLAKACDALRFAHARGVVHRDVKPDNVMVGAFGEVYVLDWGIAVSLDGAGPARGVVGTPAYMAPEMLDGDAPLSPRADVFLLGATLHEVLTGEARHAGLTVAEVLASARAVEPHVYAADVPPELAAIANRATARDPTARFEDAGEFGAAIADFVRHRGSLELGAEGARLLDALEAASRADGDAAQRARRVGAECRFAFQHALRVWDDNAPARAGLQRCLVELVERELAESNRGAVAGLLAELPEARPDLEARLAELDRRLAADAGAKAELERLAHEGDVSVSMRQRNLGLGALVAFALALTVKSFGPASAAIGARDLVAFAGGACVLAALLLVVGRRALLRTQVNRQIVGLTAVSLVAQLGHRLAALAIGTPVADVVAADLVLLAGVTACAAVMLRPAVAVAAALLGAGAALAALVPSRATDVYGVATLLALASMVLAWRPGRADRA